MSNLCQFVHFGQGQTESKAYSVPLACLYWSVHWHTRKIGQLDTPKISEVMFLLHGCKNYSLEFLLSVSSRNNVPLVKVCAKSWTESIRVAYLLLLEPFYRIFPPSSTQQKADSICTHFWAFDYIHFRLSTLLLRPQFWVWIKRESTILSNLTHKFGFFLVHHYWRNQSVVSEKIQSHVWKPFMKINKRHFPLHPLNVLPLSHSFKTSVCHEMFFCLSQYENYSV